MEAKRKRTQKAKEQQIMRSESEQQWLARMSISMPRYGTPMGAESEYEANGAPLLTSREGMDVKRTRFSIDPQSLQQRPSRSPRIKEEPQQNYINSEKIDEVMGGS